MIRWTRILASCLACAALIAFDRGGAEAEPSRQTGETKIAKLPDGVRALEVKFDVTGGKLPGTLLLPKTPPGRRVPGILLVGGSDLNAGAAGVGAAPRAAFGELAAHLAGRGLVVLRYDSRCRATRLCGAELTPHDLNEDATSAFVFLSRRAEVDQSRVLIFGHDEGGLFAATVAANPPSEKEKVAGLILAGAPGRTYIKVLREQAQKRLVARQTPPAKIDEYLAALDKAFQVVSSGGVEVGTPPLDPADPLFAQFRQTGAYFFHLSVNDPLQIARTINVPVMIVQGEKDAHIGVRDAQYLKESLSRQYHGDASISLLPQMDHYLRAQPGEPDITLGDDPARPLDPALLALLDEWIDKRFKDAKTTK